MERVRAHARGIEERLESLDLVLAHEPHLEARDDQHDRRERQHREVAGSSPCDHEHPDQDRYEDDRGPEVGLQEHEERGDRRQPAVRNTSCRVRSPRSSDRKAASIAIRASLATSEGASWKPKSSNHRCAPLTLVPSGGPDEHEQHEGGHVDHPGVDLQEPVVEAQREHQHDRSQREERELTFHEAARVQVHRRERLVGGRVDREQTDHREPDRRRQQDRVDVAEGMPLRRHAPGRELHQSVPATSVNWEKSRPYRPSMMCRAIGAAVVAP